MSTSTSNQDILAFLRDDKDSRAYEKEEEKRARTREREEDMQKISVMISTGVQEEVNAALKPVEDRLDKH